MPRFSLECGLTIYELKLSGIKGYNAVIGGPHESFNFMLKNSGGNTAGLLAFFNQSLAKYRSLGPPSLKRREIDLPHEDFALKMNQCEVEDELRIESFSDDEMQEEYDVLNEDPSNMEAYGVTVQTCVDCGYAFNISPDSDDKIARLKKLQPAIDGVLNIEYRCSKCRDCSLCKKAIETERISLREEAEIFADGQTLIVCSLKFKPELKCLEVPVPPLKD